MDNTNFINAEIYIREEDVNKNKRIINSFENVKKENRWINDETDNIRGNEKEIKRCKIKINGKSIPFSYFYKFKKSGKYNIQYSFPNKLTNINNMFSLCSSLTNIDLSNFNTQNVTNMSDMFYRCISLTKIDLSNFNTQNVTNMNSMFYECSSLTNIDLSNFNTQNVIDMSYMFSECSSLTNIDSSNFNNEKVTNMSYMFSKYIY